MSRLLFTLPLLCLLLAACAGSEPRQQTLSPAADGHQRSFFIQAVRAEGHREDLEGRFDLAVRRALEAKGYRYQANTAQMRVIYALGLDSQTGVIQRPVSTSAGVITQTQLSETEQARLVLRILDESSGTLLFEARVAQLLQDPTLTQAAFDAAVARLLEDFPAQAGR